MNETLGTAIGMHNRLIMTLAHQGIMIDVYIQDEYGKRSRCRQIIVHV